VYNKDKTKFNGNKIFIKDGYECIMDRGNFKYVHRLIMEEYLGQPLLASEDIHHKDEDKTNNVVSNFEIKSHRAHARHHLSPNFKNDAIGSKNSMSKLNEKQVSEIISKVYQESDIQKVADEYNVHYATIWGIWKGRTWKHVER